MMVRCHTHVNVNVNVNVLCTVLQISMRGVQLLSEALEKAKDRGVEHVYVHSQGRIDALGTKLQGSQVRQKSTREPKLPNHTGIEVTSPLDVCSMHSKHDSFPVIHIEMPPIQFLYLYKTSSRLGHAVSTTLKAIW